MALPWPQQQACFRGSFFEGLRRILGSFMAPHPASPLPRIRVPLQIQGQSSLGPPSPSVLFEAPLSVLVPVRQAIGRVVSFFLLRPCLPPLRPRLAKGWNRAIASRVTRQISRDDKKGTESTASREQSSCSPCFEEQPHYGDDEREQQSIRIEHAV
jgi:hypothetical protein